MVLISPIIISVAALIIYLCCRYIFKYDIPESTFLLSYIIIGNIFSVSEYFLKKHKTKKGTVTEKSTAKKSREAFTENNNPAETKTVPTQNLPSKTIPKDIKLENLLDYLFAFSKKHSDGAVSLHIYPSKENLSVVAFDIFFITSCKISGLRSNEADMISRLFVLFEGDNDFQTYKFTLKTSEKKNSAKQVYDQIVSEVKKYSKAHNVSFYIRDFGVEYKFN